jgi:hypothetical protein
VIAVDFKFHRGDLVEVWWKLTKAKRIQVQLELYQ